MAGSSLTHVCISESSFTCVLSGMALLAEWGQALGRYALYTRVCMRREPLLKANLCICCVSVIYCNGSQCSLSRGLALKWSEVMDGQSCPTLSWEILQCHPQLMGLISLQLKTMQEAIVIFPVEWY